MIGGLTAAIFVGVAMTVASIIAVIWFYRKRSQNAESEANIILRRKRPSESYDYLLLDKNAINRITLDLHTPVKVTKTPINGYDDYTDKPSYHKMQDKEIPAVTSNKRKSKSENNQDCSNRNEYRPSRKRNYGKSNYETVGVANGRNKVRNYETSHFATIDAGDGHKAIKHTCRDGKYKHCDETRTTLDSYPLYEDIEHEAKFTRPIKKHLAKIRPVRRPSLHSRKQVEGLNENGTPLKADLIPNDNNKVSDKRTDIKTDVKIVSKSVKEIVDNVKNLAKSESENPTKTFLLTNNSFGSVSKLRERYDVQYDSHDSARHNLNMSGKGRQNPVVGCATIDKNKSDINTGKTTDRLLKRNTISDVYIDNRLYEENDRQKVNKVQGYKRDRNFALGVQLDKGGFRISDKSAETTETRTNDAVPVKAKSEIHQKAATISASIPLPTSKTFIVNEVNTTHFTTKKAPVHKTVLQVGLENKTKGYVSNVPITINDEESQIRSTLPSISNTPSPKLQQPKMSINNPTAHQIQTSADKSLDNSLSAQLSAPLLVSPVKPRPPVAPKPKTPRRMSTKSHISETMQSEHLTVSPNVLRIEHNTEQFTAISPPIQTIEPKCLPSIQRSPVHQIMGPSNLPIPSGVSIDCLKVTHGVESLDIDYNKSNLRTEKSRNINIKVADQNEVPVTNNARHVNFRSPELCEYVLRTPSPEEPSLSSPTDSIIEQNETENTGLERDSDDSSNTDAKECKVHVTKYTGYSETMDASLDMEQMQDPLNKQDSFKIPYNLEICDDLQNKVICCAENVTVSSPEISADVKDVCLNIREDRINLSKIKSTLEEKTNANLLSKDSISGQTDQLKGYKPESIDKESEFIESTGSNMNIVENRTDYNYDIKELTSENGESALCETKEEKTNSVQSQSSKSTSVVEIEKFNPNSSSTPLQSETDIETKAKDERVLEEGEETFAMIQEALAKRRKRFMNDSINSPSTDQLEQSSMWQNNTCIYTDEFSNPECNTADLRKPCSFEQCYEDEITDSERPQPKDLNLKQQDGEDTYS